MDMINLVKKFSPLYFKFRIIIFNILIVLIIIGYSPSSIELIFVINISKSKISIY